MMRNISGHKVRTLALAMLCSLGLCSSAMAAEPLKMEGKSTLYQRVLTTPSCELKVNAQDATGKKVPAFSRYYVYARDNGMLQVGPDTTGKIAGYLPETCTVPWKMQMALLFTNPAGRDRALIFKDYETLDNIVNADDPASLTKPLYQALQQGGTAPGVISEEPATYVDYTKNFYLLPVLDSTVGMFSDGFYVNELKIASVSEQAASGGSGNQAGNNAAPAGISAFKAAIVFVIDSSISMQPYIDKTKEIINTVLQAVTKEGLQDSVQFGLVSFRSNTKAVPGLEYTSKVFVKPGDVNTAEEFAAKVKELQQAKVSSSLFDEDAYSGIHTALSSVNWNNYGGRYIVLVTDAGAIEGSNKLSGTKLDARELRLEAEHYNTAIYTMHLLTKAGAKNHAKAKAQYEDLSFNQVIQKPLYYPVNAGDVNAFGRNIDTLAKAITQQVKLASEGKEAIGSAAASADKSSLENDLAMIGLAMRLRYLGTNGNTRAPDIIEGFMADRDLVSHNLPTATPVVLLTKAQLSDLYDVVNNIFQQTNTGMLDPAGMFKNLKSLAAAAGNDASTLTDSKTLKIADMGLMGEYLDDLPYRSEIANIDEESWSAMGPEEQNNIVSNLQSKLNYYRQYNEDTTRWIDLTEGADKSEAVYPVPLEALP